jgi:hypothetical protein
MSITYRPTICLYAPTRPVVDFVLSSFVFKNFEYATGTKPKSEIKQTNISANMEIKQKLSQ